MSSVFDKITSRYWFVSGSDKSSFYSAVKNMYAWVLASVSDHDQQRKADSMGYPFVCTWWRHDHPFECP